MKPVNRPIWFWLACAVSFAVLVWGGWVLLTLAEFGFLSPLEGALILLAPLASLAAIVALRWWGLIAAALFGAWLLVFSKFASIYAVTALAVFYTPVALAAFIHHRRFRW